MKFQKFTLNKNSISYIVTNSWSISWPMIIIMLMDFFIGIADVYIAGNLGKEVHASIGFVSQIYFVFMVIINGVTVGAVSVIARLFGARKAGELSQAVFSIIMSSITAGLFLATFGILFSAFGIGLLEIPESIKNTSIPLVRIYLGGIVFHYFLITSNGILRSCGMVRYSLLTMVVVCVLNISLNFTLVFYTPLDYYGIVLSTVISYFVGSILNAVQIKKLLFSGYHFNFQLLKKMLKVGWPSGLQQFLWHIGGTVLFLIIGLLPLYTVETIAAFTNGLRIEAAIYVLAYALNNANGVIIANYLGEQKKSDAFKSGIITAVIGVIIITFQTAFVILNAEWISRAISPNQIVIKETMRYLYISMLSEPFMAWAVIISGALVGAGDTKTVSKIVISSQWLVRLPLAYLLAIYFEFGQSAIWWAMNFSILIHAVLISFRYFRKRWIYLD